MRIPRSGELERVEARRAGSGLRDDRAGKSGRDEWARLGSAGFRRGPGADGRGGGGERREERGAGRWANQGAATSGCRVPAPRAPVLTEDKVVVVVFLDWELFGELCMRSGDRSVVSVRAFILKLIQKS